MAGAWWVPSLVVFGAALLVLALVVAGARRSAGRRRRAELDGVAALERRAKGLLVRTDNALREAVDEAAFAEAQFGQREAREYSRTIEQAGAWLREAFLLQQRLDDEVPDTPAERRSWSNRIEGLCESALAALERSAGGVAALRAAERGVDAEAPAMREDAERLARRLAAARTELDRIAGRFEPAALAGARDSAERAEVLLVEARAALDETDAAGPAGRPLAASIGIAAARLERAAREIDVAERAELALVQAQAEARVTAAELEGELEAARRERERTEDAEVATALGAAIAEGAARLAERSEAASDPVADGERLQAARAVLDAARAAARASQSRLDGARAALDGAIAIAEGQIRAANAAIDRLRGRVGADARTRLAEAERQLQHARDEADPVAALDAARRATSRANDAEGLALYDALSR